MKTITDNTLGMAIWLAAEFAAWLEREPDEALAHSDNRKVAANLRPVLDEECQEEHNKEVMPVIDLLCYWELGEEVQTSLFDPVDFLKHIDTLFGLVREGKLTFIAAVHEIPWRICGDNDIDVGFLCDPTYLLTFHEKMSKAKAPVVWRYGAFLAAVDCKEL